MERKEMIDTLEMMVETFTEKIATLTAMAETSEGKWINVSSNDMVLEGWDMYYDEEGRWTNRLGINGTGYTTDCTKAQIFDTEDEAYNNGNFYLETQVNGKRRTIYVGAQEAAPYFRNKVEIFKGTLEMCKTRLAELNA